jgi:hypothetical protein
LKIKQTKVLKDSKRQLFLIAIRWSYIPENNRSKAAKLDNYLFPLRASSPLLFSFISKNYQNPLNYNYLALTAEFVCFVDHKSL